jgi:hypothetical protein
MKTSNKILLGLLVVVFAVPLLLAASLKSKIKNGIYTVEKRENYRNLKVTNGSFDSFKAVKVISPKPEYLKCFLKASSEMNFNYTKENGTDSVIVSTINDTLVIRYISLGNQDEKKSSRDWDNSIAVKVNLPAFNNLIVDGAVVIIDSFPASTNNMSVVIKNRGELKDASSKKVNKDEDISKAIVPVKAEKRSYYNAIDKKVEVARNIQVKAMQLDVKELLVYGLISRIKM